MKKIKIKAPLSIKGSVKLEGSKSISNRLLIMRALCGEPFVIKNLSPSDDTQTLQRLLDSNEYINDVGAAGTTMRFLISYFSILEGERILTGSERMKKRPVQVLVDALHSIGADIQYEGDEGFPPLKISGKKISGGKIKVRSDISSQYISSLMMIAPVLENGLELELTGKISSYPYINMTLKTMAMLGIRYEEHGNLFKIYPGTYTAHEMIAESDWSAASYYFSVCALCPQSVIRISGVLPDSLQGDHIVMDIYRRFGVESHFEKGVLILQQKYAAADSFEFDFSDCPDIAQTVAVIASALGVPAAFTGVESLRIKETDRTQALSDELKKFGVSFYQDNDKWMLKGKIQPNDSVSVSTYEDHRMAMSFAPLSCVLPDLIIEEPDVVKKSYPSFWSDLASLGFSVSFI